MVRDDASAGGALAVPFLERPRLLFPHLFSFYLSTPFSSQRMPPERYMIHEMHRVLAVPLPLRRTSADHGCFIYRNPWDNTRLLLARVFQGIVHVTFVPITAP